jgi:hypothetical protein
MSSYQQYTRAEDEHAEMACLFDDEVKNFIEKYKLDVERMIILLNDEIIQLKEEKTKRVCDKCKKVLPDEGIVTCCGIVYGEDEM